MTIAINKVTVPHTNAGYNLTDSASFVTSSGSTPFACTWSSQDLVVVKSTNDGLRLVPHLGAFPGITNYGGAVTDPSFNAAPDETAEVTQLFRFGPQFVQADGTFQLNNPDGGFAQVLVLLG